MSKILCRSAVIDFPVYSAGSRSLKSKLLHAATGGAIGADVKGRVIVRALADIDLDLSDGDRLAILGHNGSGKSTILRMLAGVYPPTAGEVSVIGTVGSLIDISLGIDSEASGIENIYLRAALLGIPKRDVHRRLEEIVEFSELGDFITMPVRTYSSGMNMRLAFSISTILRPDILIMDEWLSVGDEAFQNKAEQRMKTLISETKILIIATHNRDLALNLCNKAILLEHGCIVARGTPETVCPQYFT